MKSIVVNFWAEQLKVRKSGVFWISVLFFVFVSFMMGLMIFIQKHPELSEKMGLIGAKASMLRFGEPNWQNYFNMLLQIMGGIGFVGFGFVTSWIFGREYTDHTVKDLLALPVSRDAIVFSKLLVIIFWSILLIGIFLGCSLTFGHWAGINGWTSEIFQRFLGNYSMVALLTLLLCTTTSFFASLSRGILLPVGIVILTMIMANFTGLIGLGPYFPWAIPGLYCAPHGEENLQLQAASYIILLVTSAAGLIGTFACWRYADQK